MILKSTMARSKMCPVTKVACAGSDCMIWKWWVPPVGKELLKEEKPHGVQDKDKYGYCGLSGAY